MPESGTKGRPLNGEPLAEASASTGRRAVGRGLAALALALAPSLLAIAATPGFTTQDGPAHVYSARILNASLASASPFAATFRVAWQPLPNWGGHLATMLAVAIFSPEVANRVVTAGTLVAFAAGVVWLRWVVAGREGIEVGALLGAILGLNVTWLLGFTSWLLGATVAMVTMGVWWLGRDRCGPSRSVGLAGLLVLGYFCHPISLGLTLGGLAVLAVATPGVTARRLAWTGASGLPLVPLGLAYRTLTRSGGGLEPVWNHWTWPWSVGVVSQLGWVDPLSLAAKTTNPLQWPSAVGLTVAFVPVLWALAGLGLLTGLTWADRHAGRRGWLALAVGLVAAGVASPDTLGVKHGHFLPQRIVLLGLVAAVPWLKLNYARIPGRLAVSSLGLAWLIQSAFVWDYAAACHDRVRPFLRVIDQFHPGDRSGTLLNAIQGRFRANPLLHADGLIAATTDSVFWTNYETAQYYFPVKVRPEIAHPVATGFELVAILDEPRDADRRALLWSELLGQHGSQMAKVVEWRSDPKLDAMLRRNYEVTVEDGPLRVWTRTGRPH